ncbi:MAG: CpaF family protein [Alphaproteobacteria bacterium]|nr:CpaF family protein [Alphaproteobacteria bacterium]
MVRLIDLVKGGGSEATTSTSADAGHRPEEGAAYQDVKSRLHNDLVDVLNVDVIQGLPRAELEQQLRDILTEMMQQRALPITREEQQRAVGEIIDEVVGYGPIERLLHDPEVSDILINGHDDVWVEMRGKLHRTNIRFRDDGHLMHVIHRIVAAVGRRIDESNPYVDARLADGSRFNAIIPPLAIDGPTVSIRRFGAKPLQAADLVRFGTLPRPVLALLEACIQGKLNVLVSGGTGSGKTTLLNVLSGYIPDDERVVTIEDAAELKLQQPHVVRLETRPPNIEGEGEVTTRDLVRNALRMRPDRIVVGEIRGAEAIDMLQAMNTGHEGSISTVHANSPRHALRRIETMVGLGMGNIPGTSIREMISDALDLIIQIARMPDGSRRLTSIAEITGMEGEVISTQEVFRFRRTGLSDDGHVQGVFEGTGVRPMFARRLASWGLEIPEGFTHLRQEI